MNVASKGSILAKKEKTRKDAREGDGGLKRRQSF